MLLSDIMLRCTFLLLYSSFFLFFLVWRNVRMVMFWAHQLKLHSLLLPLTPLYKFPVHILVHWPKKKQLWSLQATLWAVPDQKILSGTYIKKISSPLESYGLSTYWVQHLTMFIFIFRLATIKEAIQDVPVVKRTEQDVGQDYLEMYGTGDYVSQSDFPTPTIESPSPEVATCAPPLPAKLRYFIPNSFRHYQFTIFLSLFF